MSRDHYSQMTNDERERNNYILIYQNTKMQTNLGRKQNQVALKICNFQTAWGKFM